MNLQQAFRNLRSVLASLYDDKTNAQRVAHDAGLNISSIKFSFRSLDNWHAILQEAIHANRVNLLLDIVLDEYPDHPHLRTAAENFRRSHGIDPASSNLQTFNHTLAQRPSFWERPIQWIVGMIGLLSALVTIYVFASGRASLCDAISLPQFCSNGLQPLTGYDFEAGIQGWDTSEGEFKLATLESTADRSYSGQRSLKVTTELYGDASEGFASRSRERVFLSTEAKVYFKRFPPEGVERAGPYNLTEKTVSCYAYFPAGLVLENNQATSVRLFVKDALERNQYSNYIYLSKSNVEQWILLSLKVGVEGGIDFSFDPTTTNALGVRVDLPMNSRLTYIGSFYIDRCAVEYP